MYYYGSTKNLKIRFAEHVKGNVSSTRYRRPLVLIYYEAYQEHSQAIFREKQVKASGAIRASLHKRST